MVKKKSSNILKFIKSKIVEQTVFLLIKPEWDPRCEHFVPKQHNDKYIFSITKPIVTILKKHCSIYSTIVQSQLNLKGPSTNSIIKRVSFCKTVSKQLSYLLKKQNFFDGNIQLESINECIQNNNELSKLFHIIMYIGLEWFIYTNLKCKDLYKSLYFTNQDRYLFFISNCVTINKIVYYLAKFFHARNFNLKYFRCVVYKYNNSIIYFKDVDLKFYNPSKYIFNPSKESIKDIYSKIRNKLYHKNSQGYWRINQSVNPAHAVLFVNQILNTWYDDYYNLLKKTELFKISQVAEEMLYIWQIKKYNI